MSLQLIDTVTGEIVRDYPPVATQRQTRQLKQQARRRPKTRQRASYAVWQHLILAGIAGVLTVSCLVWL